MRLLALALFAALSLALTGCASDDNSSTELPSNSVIIDVRTPAEFAEGHLEGAINIDVSAAGFADQVAALDQKVPYVVYCRSGNRSASAVATMRSLGFTEVTDAGGMQAAADSTGLDIVQD